MKIFLRKNDFFTFFQLFFNSWHAVCYYFWQERITFCALLSKKGMIFNGPSGSSEVRMGFL